MMSQVTSYACPSRFQLSQLSHFQLLVLTTLSEKSSFNPKIEDSFTMQSIISSIAPVIGLGSTTESGQEPRSGIKGTGTAVDPYDGGNAESQFEHGG